MLVSFFHGHVLKDIGDEFWTHYACFGGQVMVVLTGCSSTTIKRTHLYAHTTELRFDGVQGTAMSCDCGQVSARSAIERLIVRRAFFLNAMMCVIGLGAAYFAQSTSILADAIDMAADSAPIPFPPRNRPCSNGSDTSGSSITPRCWKTAITGPSPKKRCLLRERPFPSIRSMPGSSVRTPHGSGMFPPRSSVTGRFTGNRR